MKDNGIRYIVRGNKGDWVERDVDDAMVRYTIFLMIADVDLILLCRTPDGEEKVLTRTNEPIINSPCDTCKYIDLCRDQGYELD